jgi:hypothetical protein
MLAETAQLVVTVVGVVELAATELAYHQTLMCQTVALDLLTVSVEPALPMQVVAVVANMVLVPVTQVQAVQAVVAVVAKDSLAHLD